MVSPADAFAAGLGPYPVTVVPHHLVKVTDGTRLALRVWFPSTALQGTGFEDGVCLHSGRADQPHGRFPTILEYLPYRHADYTVERDHARHTWFCSHGYVCVRADIRGSGNSEGLLLDEYTLEEQKDACELIAWIADQAWSSGRVGMFGKSWGGATGLQVAYHQPPALKTIITLYSTDDRFATEMYHWGGFVTANGLLPWGALMFAWMGRPPSPEYVPDWKKRWLHRMEKAGKPWHGNWIAHRTYDDYWKNGSVREDYSKIRIPVLAVGGWADGYTDAVFRLVENMPQCYGLIGPWSHDWPDTAEPGPRMDFASECLRWWDRHLKSDAPVELPKLRTYIRDSVRPLPVVDTYAGVWINADSSDSQTLDLALIQESRALVTLDSMLDMYPAVEECHWSSAVGLHGGAWLVMGTGAQLSADQSLSDGCCLTWQTSPLPAALILLGRPVLKCCIRFPGRDEGQLAVRLCDVHEGKSSLISQGFLDVQYSSGENDGNFLDVEVSLKAVGYRIETGHRLRLAVSPGCWPSVWPSTSTTMNIQTGVKGTFLSLPLIAGLPEEKGASWRKFLDAQPKRWLSNLTKEKNKAEYKKAINYDFDSDTYTVTIKTDRGHKSVLPLLPGSEGMVFSENGTEEFTINGSGPLSARVSACHRLEYNWHNVSTRIVTESHLWADSDSFHVSDTLHAFLDGESFFEKTWKEAIPRT